MNVDSMHDLYKESMVRYHVFYTVYVTLNSVPQRTPCLNTLYMYSVHCRLQRTSDVLTSMQKKLGEKNSFTCVKMHYGSVETLEIRQLSH